MNTIPERLRKLRSLMKENHIDYYIITSDDYHGSEYTHEYFKSRQYISGFTGSAGTLLIGISFAGLWTDGRYFIQAANQLEGSGIELFKTGQPGVPSIENYLAQAISDGQTLSYDGRTVSYSLGSSIASSLNDKNIRILNQIDLVDKMWNDRPPFPVSQIWLLTDKQTGMSISDKLQQLRSSLKHAILISALDDIAWLYNYRGNDVLHTPVAMAYTIVDHDSATLYISPDAVSKDIRNTFEKDGITLKPYLDIYNDVAQNFGSSDSPSLQVDKASVNQALTSLIFHPVFDVNPTLKAKACKNTVEIANEKSAHLKDGVAFTKTIYKLKQLSRNSEHSSLTELSVADMILEDRKSQEDFISLSFDSIVAYGEHGAIVHYSPSPETSCHLSDGLLLMDTGAQYLDGTTDVTRTIALGHISDYEKECYTTVLRGNLNLGAAIFPYGTSGRQLDCLARIPLWQKGLDYNHGTGHGVGYILNVHEGPNRISKSGSDTPFEPGMITSNEPGVYIENKFGIRLENLILCTPDSNHPGFMNFETLTLVPFDRDAIAPELMTTTELNILNEYHATVFKCLSPFMNEKEHRWLKEATAPIL